MTSSKKECMEKQTDTHTQQRKWANFRSVGNFQEVDRNMSGRQTCQFARVVKGVDQGSTAGNCAWVRVGSNPTAGMVCYPSMHVWQKQRHSNRRKHANYRFVWLWGRALPGRQTCQFARVVKGLDPGSTAGNCAWVRSPQLAFSAIRE